MLKCNFRALAKFFNLINEQYIEKCDVLTSQYSLAIHKIGKSNYKTVLPAPLSVGEEDTCHAA